jgi:acyl carrier protein
MSDSTTKEGIWSGMARRLGLREEQSRRRPLGTEAEIRQWLVERLAAQLKVAASSIEPGRSFEAYGLDSRTAVQVSGELEKVIERRLSPALLIEHPTIDAVARELARELSGEASND